jgi:transposase
MTAGKPEPRKRRQFTARERAEAVRIVRSSKKSVRQVAEELGISEKTLWPWVNKAKLAEIDPEGSMPASARAVIREQQKKIAQLERDLEFEKKAKAFLRELDQRGNGSR